jgi:leukotriene-A4 hydrolase
VTNVPTLAYGIATDVLSVQHHRSSSCDADEKGYSLLRYLEGLVGGPEAFAPFVIAYVAEFAYKTLTSDDFRQFFTNYWNNKGVDTSMVDWETWYTAVGMPPVTNEVDGSLAVAPAELKQRWATGGDGCSSADIDGWVNGQTLRFLDSLLDDDFAAVSTAALLTKMDGVYSFSSSGNAEVRFRWQRLGIQAEMPEIIPQV